MCIMDSLDQVLRCKTVRLGRCCGNSKEWRRQHGNAMTQCVPPILFLFKVEGTWFSRLVIK